MFNPKQGLKKWMERGLCFLKGVFAPKKIIWERKAFDFLDHTTQVILRRMTDPNVSAWIGHESSCMEAIDIFPSRGLTFLHGPRGKINFDLPFPSLSKA